MFNELSEHPTLGINYNPRRVRAAAEAVALLDGAAQPMQGP